MYIYVQRFSTFSNICQQAVVITLNRVTRCRLVISLYQSGSITSMPHSRRFAASLCHIQRVITPDFSLRSTSRRCHPPGAGSSMSCVYGTERYVVVLNVAHIVFYSESKVLFSVSVQSYLMTSHQIILVNYNYMHLHNSYMIYLLAVYIYK